jgi:hypothetical protein
MNTGYFYQLLLQFIDLDPVSVGQSGKTPRFYYRKQEGIFGFKELTVH